MDQIESSLTIPVRALQKQLQKDYQVGFSIHKVFRAKSTAKKLSRVITKSNMMFLEITSYSCSLLIQKPLLSATSRRFKRMYVCLGGMKKGFRAFLRDFLGFDGAFMKGPFLGQILAAVGVDSNNGIYPLAYAIVETENTDRWKWFLECITDDLDLYTNSNFTFISDKQKYKEHLYNCATTTTVPEFNHRMQQFSSYDIEAYNWLK
uniref:MULE transposase domain-containing protein n=1 Tax=Lactuca sativa TaxID=4236 RepID=A0A9R1WKZ6_LACSA|nr:hypothetical protein LSAT_V11C100000470 [Lactuca sativa]